MREYTAHDVQQALAPIRSLISKSEKASQKVAPGTWQHTMLCENVAALRLALELMGAEARREDDVSPDQLRDASRAVDSMVARTEKAGAKFSPGTSQHTLQRNRLCALRVAQAFIRDEAAK
jgi:hypothetical protein